MLDRRGRVFEGDEHMKQIRVYSDPSGETHIEDLGDVLFTLADYAPPAPRFGVSPFAPAVQYGFIRLPPGWYGDWHPVPSRQVHIYLSGELEGQASDGSVVRVGPGSVILMEDTSGKGHVSRVIGDEDVVIAVVRLPD
jgi:quercetin dioxygenase-like cupin family protein